MLFFVLFKSTKMKILDTCLVLGGALLGLDDLLHLLALSLGADVASKTLLAELESALVLANAQQFNASSLVRGEAGNLADDVVHKLRLLGLVALGAALVVLVAGELAHLVALVRSGDHLVRGWCHVQISKK
jgi:hypothetical protein